MSVPPLRRGAEVQQSPSEPAGTGVGEGVVVGEGDPPVEVVRQAGGEPLRFGELDGTPDVLDRVEAGLLLTEGAEDAVGSGVARHVDGAPEVVPHDALVDQCPQEASGGEPFTAHQLPVVVEPRAGAAVVEAVEELGGHEDVALFLEDAARAVVRLVVVGVDAAEVRPGVEHGALLGVVAGVVGVEGGVPAAFVAVAPEQDRRVVDVTGDHRGDEGPARLLVVELLPAGQFVEHVQPEFVGEIEEVRVRRVVGHPDRVHVHLLHQEDVLAADACAGRPAGRGPDGVPVGSLEDDLDAVDVHAVAGAHLDGAEAESVVDAVDGAALTGAERDLDAVEVRGLRRPLPGGVDRGPEGHLRVSGSDGRGERGAYRAPGEVGDPGDETVGGTGARQMGVDPQRAVGAGVDGDAFDVLERERLQVDGAVDAAEVPVVTEAFGPVDGVVGGLLADRHLQEVVLARPQLVGHLVPEPVEAAAVDGPRRLAVEPRLGLGHRPFEDEEDASVTPVGGRREGVPVAALLLRAQVPPVVVRAVSVELPVGRNRDAVPTAAAPTAGAQEVPVDRVVGVLAGQIQALGARGGVRSVGRPGLGGSGGARGKAAGEGCAGTAQDQNATA